MVHINTWKILNDRPMGGQHYYSVAVNTTYIHIWASYEQHTVPRGYSKSDRDH